MLGLVLGCSFFVLVFCSGWVFFDILLVGLFCVVLVALVVENIFFQGIL